MIHSRNTTSLRKKLRLSGPVFTIQNGGRADWEPGFVLSSDSESEREMDEGKVNINPMLSYYPRVCEVTTSGKLNIPTPLVAAMRGVCGGGG